ncbi:MAG: hypothetical protein AW12_02769 [Candidatus Accumulibacter sp. BA-94]|nr:MAG: hypothetical protein AW12_02769 [Candidatus Accumulibacter sp. BA-94]
MLDGRLPAAAAARGVLDEMKINEPQDLAMLSAGLAELRRVMDCLLNEAACISAAAAVAGCGVGIGADVSSVHNYEFRREGEGFLL